MRPASNCQFSALSKILVETAGMYVGGIIINMTHAIIIFRVHIPKYRVLRYYRCGVMLRVVRRVSHRILFGDHHRNGKIYTRARARPTQHYLSLRFTIRNARFFFFFFAHKRTCTGCSPFTHTRSTSGFSLICILFVVRFRYGRVKSKNNIPVTAFRTTAFAFFVRKTVFGKNRETLETVYNCFGR